MNNPSDPDLSYLLSVAETSEYEMVPSTPESVSVATIVNTSPPTLILSDIIVFAGAVVHVGAASFTGLI